MGNFVRHSDETHLQPVSLVYWHMDTLRKRTKRHVLDEFMLLLLPSLSFLWSHNLFKDPFEDFQEGIIEITGTKFNLNFHSCE